jgi:hypothetical protein
MAAVHYFVLNGPIKRFRAGMKRNEREATVRGADRRHPRALSLYWLPSRNFLFSSFLRRARREDL